MLKTVAVGTDGTGTASQAVDFAIDLAEKYGARLVAISSYEKVSESRLRSEQRDAPHEVQWTINPTEDVESLLSDVEEKAHEHGLEITTVASEGNPAEVLCSLCRGAGGRRAGDRQQGHAAPAAGQRAQLGRPSRALLGDRGQDDLSAVSSALTPAASASTSSIRPGSAHSPNPIVPAIEITLTRRTWWAPISATVCSSATRRPAT